MSADTGMLNLRWARCLVAELQRCGVRNFCLSPGSRCTPLTVAVAASGASKTIHFDERSTAFYGLGQARGSGAPTALICTSGTAAANYLPALIEANFSRQPLIVLTTDRPPELRDTGANQTIDQVKMFGDVVRWQCDLPCPASDLDEAWLRGTVDHAVHRAMAPPAGPVHLNCMFREPFLPPDLTAAPAPAGELPRLAWMRPRQQPSDEGVRTFLASARTAARGLIVCGVLPSELRPAVLQLAAALGWPVYADILSGLRLGSAGTPVVPYLDQLLHQDLALPASVLVLGGRVLSKRLSAYLTRCAGAAACYVSEHPRREHPGECAGIRVQCDVDQFVAAALAAHDGAAAAGWLAELQLRSRNYEAKLDALLAGNATLSEPQVARTVSRLLPAGHGLFLGNSMPVRDMDMFAAGSGAPAEVAANRGASGIDGLVATAAGFAAGRQTPVTAVIGDVSVLHDQGALKLLRQGPPLTLVIINNDGGGIFGMLPIAGRSALFEPYFATPHGLNFASLAAMYDLSYAAVGTHADFAAVYASPTEASRIIEVEIERDDNLAVHRRLRQLAQDLA